MTNLIKNYLEIKIPSWMQVRKSLFIFYCLDFFIFFFIKSNYLKNEGSKESIFISLILSLLWCLVSYINGKYSYYTKNENLILKAINLLKSNLVSLIFIYFIDKLIIIYFPQIIPFGKNKILLLGIISFLLQFAKLFFYTIRRRKKKIYILGNINEIDDFRNLIKGYPVLKNIEFLNMSNEIFKESEKKQLLILNEELEKKYNFSNIRKFNIERITPFRWCERYLNSIPVKYLNILEYDSYDLIIDFDNFQWRLKRFLDIIISLLLLLISFPFLVFFSLLIWIEDKGPIFYSQMRTGLNGKVFKITKLRSMKHQAEQFGPVWASKDDKRITKIGGFLRKARIDELPQLISVLIGDMSLIGPRPERPEIELTLKEKIPFYKLKHSIKPGISGWAQVNYPYGASIKDSEIKLSYELFYIRNQSLLFDILIFIKTIKLIFNMKGSKPIK